MSELKKLFEALSSDVKVKSVCYVHYNVETGKIDKISTRQDLESEHAILEVEYDSVKEILNGTKKTEDFVVSYDISIKGLSLKEISYESELETAEHKFFELPSIKNDLKNFYQKIYKGAKVYIWVPNKKYYKNSLVWYKNNVYKLTSDVKSEYLPQDSAYIYVENVLLTNVKTNFFLRSIKKIVNKEIYKGVHVDVWYKELEHLAGQHVFYDNNVYKIKNKQPKNTDFDYNNCDLVLKSVKLLNDKNPNLNFEKIIDIGDNFLDNNKLYTCISSADSKTNEFVNMLYFYVDDYTIVFYDSDLKDFVSMSLNEENEELKFVIDQLKIDLEVLDQHDIQPGQKILIENEMYQVENHDINDYELHVCQNHRQDQWEIYLNSYVKNKLIKSNYLGNELLFFSITQKHDPSFLFRSIKIKVSDLLSGSAITIPYQYDWEYKKKDVSIFTPKYFNSYIHEILE